MDGWHVLYTYLALLGVTPFVLLSLGAELRAKFKRRIKVAAILLVALTPPLMNLPYVPRDRMARSAPSGSVRQFCSALSGCIKLVVRLLLDSVRWPLFLHLVNKVMVACH